MGKKLIMGLFLLVVVFAAAGCLEGKMEGEIYPDQTMDMGVSIEIGDMVLLMVAEEEGLELEEAKEVVAKELAESMREDIERDMKEIEEKIGGIPPEVEIEVEEVISDDGAGAKMVWYNMPFERANEILGGKDEDGITFSGCKEDNIQEIRICMEQSAEIEEPGEFEEPGEIEEPGEFEQLSRERANPEGDLFSLENEVTEPEDFEDEFHMEVEFKLPAEPVEHNASRVEDETLLVWEEEDIDELEKEELYFSYYSEDVYIEKDDEDEEDEEKDEEEKEVNIDRISGRDRYETAVEISRELYNETERVVLATGQDFPDAIAGTPLAYNLRAPILLTRSNELIEVTKNEFKRLGAKEVIILGGTAAVGSEVEDEIKGMGMDVERIAGEDRYDTALKINEKLDRVRDEERLEFASQENKGYIASGQEFTGALTAAPYAAVYGDYLLLTREGELYSGIKEFREDRNIAGYDICMVDGIEEEIKDDTATTKIIDKIDHKEEILENITMTYDPVEGEESWQDYDGVVITTEDDYPDALAGGMVAAEYRSPLVMIEDEDDLKGYKGDIIGEFEVDNAVIIGGEAAVGEEAEEKLEEILKK